MQVGYITSWSRTRLTTGYGKLAQALMLALQAAGVETLSPWEKPDLPTIVIGEPTFEKRLEEPIKRAWALTMCESDKLHPKWVACLNRHYERVLVPSPMLVDVFRDSGVTIPIHNVEMGVNFPFVKYVERNPAPETFTWLTYSLGDMRKGAELALFAFKRLFGGDPRYKMVVKCRDDAHWLRGLVDEQISVVEGCISEAQWQTMMANAQAFVFPTRGEGKGLPPFEATLSGLPTVATAWLGLWDVAEWGYAVPVHTMRPVQFDSQTSNAPDGRWAEPSRTGLDAQMLRVANHYREALEKASLGRTYILRRYSYAQMAQNVVELLRAYT